MVKPAIVVFISFVSVAGLSAMVAPSASPDLETVRNARSAPGPVAEDNTAVRVDAEPRFGSDGKATGEGEAVCVTFVDCGVDEQCVSCAPGAPGADPNGCLFAELSTACLGDMNVCTTEHCDGSGACVRNGSAKAGTTCNDNIDCTTNDRCDGSGNCIGSPDDTLCDDGEFCTGTETCDPDLGCQEGTFPCSDPTPICCEAAGTCEEECCTDADCDDLLFCNGRETCLEGVCQPGAPPCNGPDGDADCIESCDEDADNCLAFDPDDAACDDGVACTINDVCTAGRCAGTPDDLSCDDGNACTSDICDPSNDLADANGCVRTNEPLSKPCEADGNLCTGEHCDGEGACVPFPDNDVTCQDPMPPCEGGQRCEPDTGACIDNPDADLSTPCNRDGNLCTGEHCDGGGLCVPFPEKDVICQEPVPPCEGGQRCEPDTGECVDNPDTPLSEPCEADDNPCTIDHCDGTGACVFLEDKDCSFLSDQCNVGVCDPATGECVARPLDLSTPCNADNNRCTGEHCDGNGACVPFPDYDVICQDPVPPCEGGQRCLPDTGECVDNPDADLSTPCNRDGDLCTGEHCDGAGLCVPFPEKDVVCQDPSPPCEGGQRCEPDTGECIDLRDAERSTPCEADDNPCTIDHCDGTGACVFLEDKDCSVLSDQCNVGVCDPATGECVARPLERSRPCNADNNRCTGEHCDGQGACVPFPEYDVICQEPVPPCEGGQRCLPDTGECVDNPDAELSTPCEADGASCTIDHCDGAGNCLLRTVDDAVCNDGITCTEPDYCDPGQDTADPETGCVNVPRRPLDRFKTRCPDVGFHLAVVNEPTVAACDGRPDCTKNDPPASCEQLTEGGQFFVEVWVTKFSPDLNPDLPDNPGLSCAHVDLVSHAPVNSSVGIAYGAQFNAGPGFESGIFKGNGGVTDLGACSTIEPGVGVWPEWVLLARVELAHEDCSMPDDGVAACTPTPRDLSFELAPSTNFVVASIYGEGAADAVDLGQRCDTSVPWCRAHIYDLDEDCIVFIGDLSLFAGCWLKCPDQADYGGCDRVNFVNCPGDSSDDCVGPEDFAFWVTCWEKCCDDPSCILPPECPMGAAALQGLPPWPSDELMRSFGLTPPARDWKGYQRPGIVQEWRQRDRRERIEKKQRSVRPTMVEPVTPR